MASSNGCHAREVTESSWPTKVCNLVLRFLKSHIPIDLSAEPVAMIYSDAGLNERALIASVCPLIACVADAVVVGFRISRI